MAGTNGGKDPDIVKELMEKGPMFSFFQVLRLLKMNSGKDDAPMSTPEFPVSHIKVRPHLSLSFPVSGVESVSETDKGKFTVRSNLLSLYGTCSPLPTFYTEDLMEEAWFLERTVRDVMDVINHRLYELLFAAWSRNRSMHRIVDEADVSRLNRFFSLMGIHKDTRGLGVENPEMLLRYSGLFSMKTRSAKGLEALLSDALGNISIRIIQMIERKGSIAEDQRARLGHNIILGLSSNLGSEVSNINGAFRIEIGPVSDTEYRRLLPGHEDHCLLIALIAAYLDQPLDYDMDIIMDSCEKPGTLCLGGDRFSSLGLDTWVFSDEGPDQFRTRFYPEKHAA